jgi:hypothetical protein
MTQVLRNAELLIPRLAGRGWLPLGGSFRAPPTQDDARAIKEVEARTGAPLPPSLKAFWEVVGGIDLVWDYRQDAPAPDFGLELPIDELDPVSMDPARHGSWLLADWLDEQAGVDPGLVEPFRWDLAPDQLHKANISGGPPYGVELPFLGADPPFGTRSTSFRSSSISGWHSGSLDFRASSFTSSERTSASSSRR